MKKTQRPGQPIETFGKEFLAHSKALEALWGRLQPHKLVGTGVTTAEQKEAGEQFKAALFLGAVDQDKYESVLDNLHADYLNGADNYPKDIEAAIDLLKKRRDTKSRGNMRRAATFAQGDDEEENDEEERSGVGNLTLEDLEQQVEDAQVSEPPGRRSHYHQDANGNWVDRRTGRRVRNSGGAFQA